MGGAQSSSGAGGGGGDQDGVKGLESKFRGTGDLAILERAFSFLSASSSGTSTSSVSLETLQKSFGLAPIYVDKKTYPELCKLVSGIGPAIVTEFFGTEKEEVSWVQLLQGYEKCSQVSGGNGLKLLFAVYSRAADECAPGNSGAKIVDDIPGSMASFDVVGYLKGAQLREFLWFCWLLMCYTRLPSTSSIEKLEAFPPEIDCLLSAAIKACDDSKPGDSSEHKQGNDLEKELSVLEISSWLLATTPGVGDCLVQFLRAQLEKLPITKESSEKKEVSSSSGQPGSEGVGKSEGKQETQETSEKNTLLLQSGVAWAIGLSLRDYSAAEILFRAACGLLSNPESEYPNAIYRSSTHGRGLNRFWSCVQGYQGLSLFLIMARTQLGTEEVAQGETFLLGGLVPGGFDNKDSFYGASGSCLFALNPTFLPIHSTGREKNFVYSHKDMPGASYKSHPKPQGVGFGGTSGKERIWIDEGFETLTVRHHAVDKTYHAGSLVPNQGYAPVVAKIVDLEIWGLGGKSADQDQSRYLKRENLFSEQRRKVDLKEMFGTWQNSPEKMMMDMVANPNAPGREER